MFSSLTSIDIGTRNIKIVQGNRRRKNLVIKKVVTIPTPPASFNEGTVVNAEAIAQSINMAIERFGLKVSNIVFTSSSTQVILRKMTIPMSDKQDAETMVKFELDQYLHIDIENYIIKYIENGFTEEEGIKKQKMMVAVYPRNMADGYRSIAKIMGKRPYALDINPNCVSKLFKHDTSINDEIYNADITSAVIDIGYYYVDINIISNGQIDFQRLIPLGTRLCIASAAKDIGVSDAYIEKKLMEEYHLYSDENSDSTELIIDNAVRTNLENLMGEIQRVFQYYKNSKPGNNIDKILIHGGGAELKGLDTYMQDALQMPIERIKNMGNVISDKNIENIEITGLLNAVGALIRL